MPMSQDEARGELDTLMADGELYVCDLLDALADWALRQSTAEWLQPQGRVNADVYAALTKIVTEAARAAREVEVELGADE